MHFGGELTDLVTMACPFQSRGHGARQPRQIDIAASHAAGRWIGGGNFNGQATLQPGRFICRRLKISRHIDVVA